VGTLEEADRVMRQTFWVGVFPGLSDPMLDYVAESIREGLETLRAR
jgi:CDP-6-deoxy-D-xylo-4-hexulose-3-dehydrase